MRFWLPQLVVFILLPFLLSGQAAAPNVPEILDNLEKQLLTGKKQAIRDLGTFLDEPKWQDEVKGLLKKYTLFTTQEFNTNEDFSRSAFLDFYYEYESKIKYSYLIHSFYITPVEQQNASYEIEPLKIPNHQKGFSFSEEFRNQPQNPSVLKKEIQTLTEVVAYSANPFDFLTYKNKLIEAVNPVLSKKHRNLVDLSAELICHFREDEDFKQLIVWEKKGLISTEKLIPYLKNLTNISFSGKEVSKNEILKKYQWKFDSLGSVEAMVAFGYTSQIKFKPVHFDHNVHYYGRILANAETKTHLKFNAIKDIIETKHNYTLFYLASQIYGDHLIASKNSLLPPSQLESILKRLTRTKLAVKFSDGALYFDKPFLEDPVATKNQFLFWASNYDNFEWSESGNYFLNTNLKMEEQQDFEVAFQQLSSKDFKVANSAFLKILDGDSETVLPLIRRYESFLGSVNPGLPNLQGGNLRLMIQLSSYCNNWGIPILLSENILAELENLGNSTDPKIRFSIEQKIIKMLDLENITAFEMWALHQNKYVEQSLSAHRIINNFYAKNGCLIIQEEKPLKLFLKKASLFQREKNYIQMIENTLCVLNYQFGNFSTSDPQINLQMDLLHLLIHFQKSPKDFFEEEMHWSDKLFRQLPPPNKLYTKRFFDYLAKAESEDRKKWVRKYLEKHYSESMIPTLFENLKEGVEEKLSLKLLNRLFQLSRTNVDDKLLKKQWQKYWKVSKKDPNKLGSIVWKAHLDWLKTQTIISEIEINQLISSPFRPKKKEKLVHEILEIIGKNKSKRGFTHISFMNELTVKNHLSYFDSVKMNTSLLKSLPDYFVDKDKSEILNFIIKKSKPDDLPIVFNDLIRRKWFRAALAEKQVSEQMVDTIAVILNQYMEDNFWITEVEENTTLANLFLLKHGTKSQTEQIEASIESNLSPGAKIALQELLINEIDFDKIGFVITIWDRLEKQPPTKPYNFLNKDFGVPFFQLEDESTRLAIINDLNTLSRKEFYKKYLLEFGITFLKENDSPNFIKIKQILKNDLVTPFSGKGGVFRDYYVFGLIKYLEAHFDESLGFHPKLNENQTFYQFNSNKRIEKWLEFLEARSL